MVDFSFIGQQGVNEAFGQSAVVYGLAAVGLNVHYGYTGLLNFGQVAFVAVGAYSLAITVATVGLPLAVGVPIGLVLAAVLALLLGIPTLRLRADYLAIVTIAASEIIRLTVRSVTLTPQTGGSSGLTSFAGDFYSINPYHQGRYGLGPLDYDERQTWLLTVGWALMILASLFVFLLMRSPWGRVLRSIREDEDAVRALGKNVVSYKMQSLVVGGVIGSLAGFIDAIGKQSVQPDSFSTAFTYFAYTALILGGAARIFGPVIGSMIFWLLLSVSDNLLRQLVAGHTFIQGSQVGQVRYMLVGLGLMALMIFRPQGIFGDKRELALDAR